ncbi:sensor histidine kinase [Marichromatium gracile]|uniref:histidine kinase n=1 Tax=Marichromatium gracile TaxID=1048 RepID=A0ABR5VE16_MARGR|nr:ATP-binding protein [Marichromatium gracile]KXX63953.1 histidine kinase [Marichromatium gracile]
MPKHASSHASTAPLDPASYPTWGALRWLLLIRLLLVVGLTLVFSPNAVDPLLARADTELAWSALLVYTLLVLLSGLSLYGQWPARKQQVYLAILVDIVVFTLLMHAAGGVASGLGILLTVTVAAGALTMEGRLTLLFAALATIAVIAQQGYQAIQGQAPAFTQAGLLGILFFAVALISQMLYHRARTAEALAARRQVDLDDLSKLNEFIIQNMATGILVADGERRLRLMNQATRELLGIAHDRHAPGVALGAVSTALAAELERLVQPGAHRQAVVSHHGRALRVSVKLLGAHRASGVILYLRDDREATAEAQRIKLAALGTLTASIAHNIRNPLSAISHAAELCAEAPGLAGDEQQLLAIVHRNSARIDEIVSSVLELSRRDRMQRQTLELYDWLRGFVDEFTESRQLGPRRLHLHLERDPGTVVADPRHLHQILANLCENALVHGGDGPVTLVLDRDHHTRRPLLEVIDQGPGIAPEVADAIFDPFFTTRHSGTGLGLYIARELAESNAMTLALLPNRPSGCRFRLLFATTTDEDRAD